MNTHFDPSMRPSIAATLAFASLTGALPAQLPITTPPGFLNTEGDSSADYFGGYANARQMFVDGEHRGRALTILEVSHRIDSTPRFSGPGRKWNKVTLDLFEADAGLVSNVFASNQLSTPTRVFDAAVTWPDTTPAPGPTPWGGPNGGLSFPFRQVWIHTGQRDIGLDYAFFGGQLTSGSPWGFGPFIPISHYSLDGYLGGTSAGGVGQPHGAANSSGCIDSAQVRGAYTALNSYSYGPKGHFPNQHWIDAQSFHTAPGQPVIHALGVVGSATGFRVPGVTCNRLHVDTNQLTCYYFKTPFAGQSAIALTDIKMAYDQNLVGLPLWFQAAWSDSTTAELRLSQATSNRVYAHPGVYRRVVAYNELDPTAASASQSGGPYTRADMLPITRYR